MRRLAVRSLRWLGELLCRASMWLDLGVCPGCGARVRGGNSFCTMRCGVEWLKSQPRRGQA